MSAGVNTYRGTGAEVMVPYFLGLLAESHGRAGQHQEGLRVLDQALAAVNRSRECWWEAELYRLKGELTLNQTGADRTTSEIQRTAADYFLQAQNIAARLNAKSLELRAAMSLSRLLKEQGKRAEARRILAEAYGWFKEGFDTTDLKDARALLDELES